MRVDALQRPLSFSIPACLGGFLAILGLGLWFLWCHPHPWLAGDAQDYFNAALAISHQGMKNWGPEPAVQLVRAPWYVLSLAGIAKLVYPWGGAIKTIQCIQVFQILLWLLNLGLIFQITNALFPSERKNYVSLISALLYTPFLFISARLLVEAQMLTFLLLFAWAWLKQKPTISGLFLFLALSDSWFGFWPKAALVALMLGCTARIKKGSLAQQCLKCLAPVLIGGLLLQAAFSAIPYRHLPLTSLIYFTDTQGFSTLQSLNGMLSLVQANGMQAFFNYINGHSLSLAEAWTFFSANSEQLFQSLGANIYRLLAQPDNIYRESWLGLSPEGLIIYHRFILFSALLCFPLLYRHRNFWLCWLIPGVWLIYGLVHIEARYNLPIMIFFIILAGLGVKAYAQAIRQKQLPASALWIGLAGLILLSTWHCWDIYPWMLQMLPALSRSAYVISQAVLGACLLLGLALAAWLQQKPATLLSDDRLVNATLILFILTGIGAFTSHLQQDPVPTAWETPLSKNAPWCIQKTIQPATAFWSAGPFRTFLLIDTSPPVNPYISDLDITVNGFAVSARSQPPAILSELKALTGGLLQPQSFRQYRFLPLSSAIMQSIQGRGKATIQLKANSHTQPNTMIYGDYPLNAGGAGKTSRYHIPHPDWGMFSIYKAQYEGEGRLTSPEIPSRGHSILLNALGSRQELRDLSPVPGIQEGQYRICIYRLLPQDAKNPQMPSPAFHLDAEERPFKVFRIAY